MFNEQELQALLIFLSRTQLEGKESMTHALLVQKLNGLLADKETPKEEPKEEKPKEKK